MPPNNGNAGEAATLVLCQRPYVIRRFYRPSTEVLPTTEKACDKGAECKFCAALQRARELELFDPLEELCSPLTPGVQLVNLSHSEDGQTLRVNLGDDWKRMFHHFESSEPYYQRLTLDVTGVDNTMDNAFSQI